jgi:integrase
MSKQKKTTGPTRGIYLRGKIYWLQLPMKNGKRPPPITLETEDLKEAISRAEHIRAHPLLTTAGTFDESNRRFIAYKLRMKEWTPGTALGKNYVIPAFADTLPLHKGPADVTPADLQKFHDSILGKKADSSVGSYMMVLRSFFNWAVEVEKIMRRNPMDQVKVVTVKTVAREEFAGYDLRDKLIREAPNDDLRFILYMGFHAGLRKNEIVEARPFWFDLEKERGMLNLRKTETTDFKDGEERSIPMTNEFRTFMRRYGLREPFVLKPEIKKGKGKYRYDFRRPFADYMKNQGVGWITPHTMRHTFASLHASAGTSIYEIAIWMGDDVRVVQAHYARLAPGGNSIEKAFGDRNQLPGVSGVG